MRSKSVTALVAFYRFVWLLSIVYTRNTCQFVNKKNSDIPRGEESLGVVNGTRQHLIHPGDKNSVHYMHLITGVLPNKAVLAMPGI